MNFKLPGLSLLASAVLYGCAEKNPEPPCNVGHGDYAAKYILESGTGACSELRGEAIGLDKYYLEDGGASLVAFQPEQATFDVREDVTRFTFGPLRSEIPENDRCFVSGLGSIDTQVNEAFEPLQNDGGLTAELIDAGVGLDAGTTVCETDGGCRLVLEPAVPVRYEFGPDVEFFVIPSAPSAQQFSTTLQYTEGACTATYKVVGMYPAVHCYKTDEDHEPLKTDAGLFEIDETLCDPNEDYEAGRLFGSGIFYTFDTFCDEHTGLCQLKADDIGPGTLKE